MKVQHTEPISQTILNPRETATVNANRAYRRYFVKQVFFIFLCCYFNLKHILSYSLYIFIYECHMHMHQPEPSVCLSLSDTCTLFHTVCLHLMFLWKEVIPRCFVPRVFSACTATVPFAFKWTSSNIEACSGEVLQSSCVKWWLLGVTLSSLSPFSLFFFCFIHLSPSLSRPLSSYFICLHFLWSLWPLPSPRCPPMLPLYALLGLHIDDVLPAGLARQAAVLLWDPPQPDLR